MTFWLGCGNKVMLMGVATHWNSTRGRERERERERRV